MSHRISRRRALLGGLTSALLPPVNSSGPPRVAIVTPPAAAPRVVLGARRLHAALRHVGVQADVVQNVPPNLWKSIFVGNPREESWARQIVKQVAVADQLSDEGFIIRTGKSADRIDVVGDDSGLMYGCFELARQVKQAGKLPEQIGLTEDPRLRFRGTNLLWMKSGSLGYDWPLTPENFPWFFDRALMLRYLDLLAENRFNTIYFWSGHPFPYLLKLPKFPEAQMLSDAELARNIEHFSWFTTEADRRGIWTVLEFYNIHVSPAFARKHEAEGVRVTNPAATPLLADYTRHCIREFINHYPSVGLLVCAGEALERNKEEWIRDVIIAAIKETGKQPPLIVREWTIDFDRFKKIVVPAYRNLYTMMKHNVEMVVSPIPNPHNRRWTTLSSHHFINLHENADIKPLRWGSPWFVQEMVESWLKLGVQGAHIYPLASWLWPHTLDRVDPALLTIDRDWIWLEAFGRYMWNPVRDSEQERKYWIGEIEIRFGSRETAEHLFTYYECTGPILPGIQNLLSIHNMNAHPTIVGRDANVDAILHAIRMNSLNVPLSQPLDRFAIREYAKMFGGSETDLEKSPPMSVSEYVERVSSSSDPASAGVMTPRNVLHLFQAFADQGLRAAQQAAQCAVRNRDEAHRFVTDAEILKETVEFYRNKTEAAVYKGLYDKSGRTADADQMLAFLEKSVASYQRLSAKATQAYRHASDLQGVITWEEMRQAFEDELSFYRDQKHLSQHGADILCLGVNGPFEDFSNAFHWSMVNLAGMSKKSLSTYMISPPMIDKARLIIVYNLADSFTRAYREQLLTWVNRGGRVLAWDEPARASDAGGLFEGLQFTGPSEERVVVGEPPDDNFKVRFCDIEHPLIGVFRNRSVEKGGKIPILNNVKSFDKRWKLLAYTIVFNKDYEFLPREKLTGCFWVKREDSQFCPLILERTLGAGRIALLQLGRWMSGIQGHKEFCTELSKSILAWAGISHC
jgi:hypothetical protein